MKKHKSVLILVILFSFLGNAPNLSIFEQQRIAEIMTKEMEIVISNHQKNVLKEV